MGKLKLDAIDVRKIIQHKDFSTFVMASLVVLFLLDVVFILMPEIRAIANSNSKIKETAQKISFAKKELLDRDKLENNLEDKSKKLDSEENRFASGEDFELLIEDISKTASDSGVKITQIKPVKEDLLRPQKGAPETLVKIPILIQAKSDYHSLGKFINGLEEADKFFFIKELEIVANISDYKSSNISMNIITILKIE